MIHFRYMNLLLINQIIFHAGKNFVFVFKTLINISDQEIFIEWAEKVPQVCKENLDKPLFIIDSDRLLASNFNSELEAILKETRYMTVLQRDNLPQEALDLFAKTQFLNAIRYNIDRVITM